MAHGGTRSGTRSVVAGLALVGAMMLAGCRTEGGGVDTSGTEQDSVPSTAYRISGELPDSLEKYVATPAAARRFADFVDGLDWQGAPATPRLCTGPSCNGNERTIVKIDAIFDADSVKLRDLPPTGIVVARFDNRGQHIERRYMLDPDNGAGRIRQYIVIDSGHESPDGSELARARARLAILAKSGANYSLTFRDLGVVEQCPGAHATERKADKADFTGCHGVVSASTGQAAARTGDPESADAWIACHQGCCTVNPDPKFPPGVPDPPPGPPPGPPGPSQPPGRPPTTR